MRDRNEDVTEMDLLRYLVATPFVLLGYSSLYLAEFITGDKFTKS